MICYNCNSARLECDTQKDAYICKDCGYEYPKQYFFISHSHKDIEKVRIIRNIIEETFFYEPILFFLKCISDESELQDLLKREIYERIWFVYCNSENATNSKYVQFERNYIEELKLKGKKFNFLEVELDKFHIWDKECYEYIRNQIAYQIRKTKVFLSYSMWDKSVADIIKDELVKNGYSVWSANDIKVNEIWLDSTNEAIKKHSYKDGIIIQIFSEDSLQSKVLKMEVNKAIELNAVIIPIAISNGYNTSELLTYINQINPAFWGKNILIIPKDNINENLKRLIDSIKNY